MEFNRLSEVEKLAEVPEAASALAENDGKIVRVPFPAGGGGNANLEDMLFDLDVEPRYSSNIPYFTNMEQIQRVIDRKMHVKACAISIVSGMQVMHNYDFLCDMDRVEISEACGIFFVNIKASGDDAYLQINFNTDEYVQNEKIVADVAFFKPASGSTVVKIYASIF